MTRIFDNIKFNLGTHLQQSLEVSDRMDVAVGYFNLRGWGAFDSLVREKVAAAELVKAIESIGCYAAA